MTLPTIPYLNMAPTLGAAIGAAVSVVAPYFYVRFAEKIWDIEVPPVSRLSPALTPVIRAAQGRHCC